VAQGVPRNEWRTYTQVVRDTYRASGVRGFYVGCLPAVIRAAPAHAVLLASKDWLYKHMPI
jgi:hypothetical protein